MIKNTISNLGGMERRPYKLFCIDDSARRCWTIIPGSFVINADTPIDVARWIQSGLSTVQIIIFLSPADFAVATTLLLASR